MLVSLAMPAALSQERILVWSVASGVLAVAGGAVHGQDAVRCCG